MIVNFRKSAAGHPCRASLKMYADADLLSSFIVIVSHPMPPCPLLVVPIADIVSKIAMVSVCNHHYCIMQQNNIERH